MKHSEFYHYLEDLLECLRTEGAVSIITNFICSTLTSTVPLNIVNNTLVLVQALVVKESGMLCNIHFHHVGVIMHLESHCHDLLRFFKRQ